MHNTLGHHSTIMDRNEPKSNRKKQSKVKPSNRKGTAQDNLKNAAQSALNALIESQQLLLDAFKTAFVERFNDEQLPILVQSVKKHLYNRDFQQTFGAEEFLEAYSMRWSPSRALAYQDLICNGPPELADILRSRASMTQADTNSSGPGRRLEEPDTSASTLIPTNGCLDIDQKPTITCIGGGAAEVMAFASAVDILQTFHEPESSHELADELHGKNQQASGRLFLSLRLHAIDMADWSPVLQKLKASIITPRPYAIVAAAKSQTRPLVSESQFSVDFTQQDVLTMDTVQMRAFSRSALVTFMFTLNELYSTSITKTTNLLLNLTLMMIPRSLLLVVDSPGSYSTIQIRKDEDANLEDGASKSEKKYPMRWLLDHTLLESSTVGGDRSKAGEKKWRKVVGEEAVWFRMRGELSYPIALEDMRYQMHLYEHL